MLVVPRPSTFSKTLLLQILGAEAVVSVAQCIPHMQSLSLRSGDSLDEAGCGEELGIGLDGVGPAGSTDVGRAYEEILPHIFLYFPPQQEMPCLL